MNNLFKFLFFFLPICLSAQQGTTLEEYRYLTRGYAYQIQMGLDAQKEGYEIKPLYTSANNVQFTGLFLNNDNQLRAIVAVIRPGTDSPKYFCIPNPLSSYDLTRLAQEDLLEITEVDKDLLDHAQREWLYAQVQNQKSEMGTVAMEATMASPSEKSSKINPSEPELTAKGIRAIPETYEIRRDPNPAAKTTSTAKPAMVSLSEADVELSGELQDRSFSQKPLILEIAGQSGKVALKVCVEPNGKVSSAKFTQRGSTTMSEVLVNSALKSAQETVFTTTDYGMQCGIMVFSYN